jgi:DNA-binding response OmpR family regulator
MAPQTGLGHTVLIVDDNQDLLDLLTEGLSEDFTVVTAGDGAEGLARYFETEPDCVVIDVKMPGIDGYQLARALRGDPATALTPLIMLTAMTQDRDRFLGFIAGVDQYLTKPALPSEVRAAIHQAILVSEDERRRRWRELFEAESPPDA